MSDTYTLELENFRSIGKATVDIAPLTVVYGPNGAGKSSLIYGLLTLKNFLYNPNQNLPSLFSYPTLSLGGFEEVVMGHDKEKLISLTLSVSGPKSRAEIRLTVGQAGGRSSINVHAPGIEDGFMMSLDIPFPYRGDQLVGLPIEMSFNGESSESTDVNVMWNGLVMYEESGNPSNREQVVNLLTTANFPREVAMGTAFIPLRRGFSIPAFTRVSNTSLQCWSTDMEVASLLASDRFLEYRSKQLRRTRLAERRVAVRFLVGTSTFTIDSIPQRRRV